MTTRQEIPIKHLKQGMYVVEIIKKHGSVNVKSEGYILNNATIEKLAKAGADRVIIDPSKEKSAEKVTKFNEKKQNQKKEEKTEKIPFDVEMSKAKVLYDDAKNLQKKLLSSITKGKVLDIKEVQQSTNAMVDSVFRNQDALACMSRLRFVDEYLVEHSLNVSILISIFAKHLHFERTVIEQLALGAFLHDIGKTLISAELLSKKESLTNKEYEQVKEHVNLGVKYLETCEDISDIALMMVAQHHERLDGSGYPKQLSGEAISQYGRMIAIVDSYDAMTAERLYKKSVHPVKAFKILISDANSSYDEELIEQFIQCIGVYPVGTLVKLNSGKLGLISQLNKKRPLNPFVHVFYNTRLNQAIPMAEIDLSKSKYQDQIDRCIKPEDFKLDLLKFFGKAFID
ncbi:MAG: phosphohydrolase [Gammaproteobacteria bacterium]|nr:MAG: phosphohydrolase [Gammaproteobacteria bacterium]